MLSKILYRRSEVYLYKSETLKARNDLERAFLCAPDSKPINKLLKVTINKQKLEKKQRKDMFGGMLTSKNKNAQVRDTLSLVSFFSDPPLGRAL